MCLRAMKSGDAFATEMKLQRRYEEEEQIGTPQKVLDWVHQVLGHDVPPCPNSSNWMSVQAYLKDGVVLCKLINKLLKTAGMQTIGYRSKAPSNFVAMNNIDNFTTGARLYGLPGTALFQTADLIEGRKGPLLNVINCINQLGFVANARGFQPKYEGVQVPKPDWVHEDFD